MGPTLLPTPLSPARGRSILLKCPANLPFRLSGAHLAPDVSSLSTGVLWGLSPALAPASSSRLTAQTLRSGPKPFPLNLLLGRSRDHKHYEPMILVLVVPVETFSICNHLFSLWPYPKTALRVPLKRSNLHLAEASCMPFLEVRVDSNPRIFET